MSTYPVLSASTLAGKTVRNPAGENLGKIEDIMLDTQTGQIAYAVLSFGGLLGVGEKFFAIPWRALKIDEQARAFILDADKERLKNAPGFDKEHWPNMADATFSKQISDYFPDYY